jgi:predicted nuclease of restriction endonuclease-like RecB superfamily
MLSEKLFQDLSEARQTMEVILKFTNDVSVERKKEVLCGYNIKCINSVLFPARNMENQVWYESHHN